MRTQAQLTRFLTYAVSSGFPNVPASMSRLLLLSWNCNGRRSTSNTTESCMETVDAVKIAEGCPRT